MPVVAFESLPDNARVWVFGSEHPLHEPAASQLLAEVDRFLAEWQAHGVPLRCARDWRERRFLTIAVDQSDAGASGCSIDGLFRALRALEPAIGSSLLGGGRVYYRDASGAVASATRDAFADLAAAGRVERATRVFDPTITTLGEWRARFETDLGQSWHAELLPEGAGT